MATYRCECQYSTMLQVSYPVEKVFFLFKGKMTIWRVQYNCYQFHCETVASWLEFTPVIPWWHGASTLDKANRVWVPHCQDQMNACVFVHAGRAQCAELFGDMTVQYTWIYFVATPATPGMHTSHSHVYACADKRLSRLTLKRWTVSIVN